jgi:hypothetical protein
MLPSDLPSARPTSRGGKAGKKRKGGGKGNGGKDGGTSKSSRHADYEENTDQDEDSGSNNIEEPDETETVIQQVLTSSGCSIGQRFVLVLLIVSTVCTHACLL